MTDNTSVNESPKTGVYFSICTVVLVLLGWAVYGCSCVFPSWQCQVGRLCYRAGMQSSAAFWFQKAADNGDSDAQYLFGFCCAKGIGVPKDAGEAYIWYEKAANHGLSAAQYCLALQDYNTYRTDTNTDKDKSCYKWVVKAMRQGNADAYVLATIIASDGAAEPDVPAEKLLDIASKYNNNIDKIPDDVMEKLRKEVGVYDENEVVIRGRNASENIGNVLGYLEYAADTLHDGVAAGQLGGVYWNIHSKYKSDKVLGISDNECVKRALHYLDESCKTKDAAACWDTAFLALTKNAPRSKDIWIFVLGGDNWDDDTVTMVEKAKKSKNSQHLQDGLFSGIVGMNHNRLFDVIPNPEDTETLSKVDISAEAEQKLHQAAVLGNKMAIEYLLLRDQSGWLEREADNVDNPGCGAMRASLGQYYELGDNAAEQLKERYHIGLCTAAKTINAKAAEWYRKSTEFGDPLGQYKTGAVYQQNGNDAEAAKWYMLAAQQDKIPQPQVALGDCYYYGKGVEQDISEAIQWYKSALKYNDARAQLVLSKCYAEGNGVEKNTKLAVMYCEWSALQGNPDAAYILGGYCEKGLSVLGNAFRWYKKAAEGFVTKAYAKMARRYFLGLGDEGVNYKKAFDWATKAAHVGEGAGHFWLARCYEGGHVEGGVDIAKVFYHYKQAADMSGYFEAYQKVAQMYIDGKGTEVNGSEAVKYLKKVDAFTPEDGDTESIKDDMVAARLQIGRLYEAGKIVPKDLAAAKTWYEKAVDGGSMAAMVALGDMYYYGRGMSKDVGEAIKLYKRASELGSGEADRNIGFAYYKGIGVAQDYDNAIKWFNKSAERGFADGMYQLGTCFEYGRGTSENPEMADYYYRLAADRGSVGGRQAIGAVKRAAGKKLEECCNNLRRIGQAIEAASTWPRNWDEIYDLVGERLYCPCGGSYHYSHRGRNYLVECQSGAHEDAGVTGAFPDYGNEHGLRTSL